MGFFLLMDYYCPNRKGERIHVNGGGGYYNWDNERDSCINPLLHINENLNTSQRRDLYKMVVEARRTLVFLIIDIHIIPITHELGMLV